MQFEGGVRRRPGPDAGRESAACNGAALAASISQRATRALAFSSSLVTEGKRSPCEEDSEACGKASRVRSY